jgi:hypothetical protein
MSRRHCARLSPNGDLMNSQTGSQRPLLRMEWWWIDLRSWRSVTPTSAAPRLLPLHCPPGCATATSLEAKELASADRSVPLPSSQLPWEDPTCSKRLLFMRCLLDLSHRRLIGVAGLPPMSPAATSLAPTSAWPPRLGTGHHSFSVPTGRADEGAHERRTAKIRLRRLPAGRVRNESESYRRKGDPEWAERQWVFFLFLHAWIIYLCVRDSSFLQACVPGCIYEVILRVYVQNFRINLIQIHLDSCWYCYQTLQ